MASGKPIKVLLAASEVWPLRKTGGLADVAYALPRALGRRGADARVVMPAYRDTLAALDAPVEIARLEVRGQTFSIWEGGLRGHELTVWLVDCPGLYARDARDPYHDPSGEPFGDNAWRFGCFSEAIARLALGAGGWTPDVLHLNDWQTGLAALWTARAGHRPRTLFTIHNLAYQGVFPRAAFEALGLPEDTWSPEGVEYWGQLSCMKAGIVHADLVTTVSPSYAAEICTPAFGCGLDGLLRTRAHKLVGVLNGIDTEAWDPAQDPHLARRYSIDSLTHGKRENRRALAAELGLAQAPESLLIGWIGRLTEQKGSDVLLQALPELLQLPVQLAILGAGERLQERALESAASQHPDRLGLRIGYDEGLAHRIEAGCDAFLMPSRFEPCGLNQMYSQRYGTVPLVRRVGGLADTVTDANPQTLADGTATGVCFENTDVNGLLYAVRRAIELRAAGEDWKRMQIAGMSRDFSWEQAADRYLELYRAG